MASYDVEPFDSKYGKFATDSAYPHDDSPLPVSSLYTLTLDRDSPQSLAEPLLLLEFRLAGCFLVQCNEEIDSKTDQGRPK